MIFDAWEDVAGNTWIVEFIHLHDRWEMTDEDDNVKTDQSLRALKKTINDNAKKDLKPFTPILCYVNGIKGGDDGIQQASIVSRPYPDKSWVSSGSKRELKANKDIFPFTYGLLKEWNAIQDLRGQANDRMASLPRIEFTKDQPVNPV